MPIFEFDPAKSEANLAKHGIDFVAAQELWKDEKLIEIDAQHSDEPRYLAIGQVQGHVWAAVCTPRSDRVRIISVRRARIKEAALYESQ